jgi:hypothetical protein
MELIILGREDVNTTKGEKYNVLNELCEYGNAMYYAVDISNLEALQNVIKHVEQEKYISSVVHLAGMDMSDYWSETEKHSLLNESADFFHEMFKGKCIGLQNLAQVVRGRPDVSFIIFSSVNSYFGGHSVAAYSAANSYVNGLAKELARNHLTKCLCWSTWANIGMSKNNEISFLAEKKGFLSLSALVGISLFDAALKTDCKELYIGLDINNTNIGKELSSKQTGIDLMYVFYCSDTVELEDEIIGDIVNGEDADHIVFIKLDSLPLTLSGDVDKEELLRLSFSNNRTHKDMAKPKSETECLLHNIWQSVLGFDSIGVNTSYFDCGGNSLNVHSTISGINEMFQIKLSVIDLYRNNEIEQLACYIERLKSN